VIGALGLIGGRYRLARELGRGAFGAVYAARLEPTGEPCAVKILTRFDQGRSAERFRREAQVLSRLGPHPNIVRVLDSGEHGGLPFVVMELVPGGSLSSALKQGHRPTVAQAARIGEQVALGLDHLHRSGVVHRDVNANNVLIDEKGDARLVDFGLALDQQRVTRITETGELLGTPLAFAPEQLDGKADNVGPEADIYAASALLYELVTGKTPFSESKSFRELAQRIRTELPTPADTVNPDVPAALARAIELGLAKKPEDRPRPAAELARLIRDAFRPAGSRSTGQHNLKALAPEPKRAGPWELKQVLERTKRGAIYEGRHSSTGALAHVRVLAVSGDLATAFERYAKLVATRPFTHPNVVAILEAGVDEGFGFVAAEPASGETLKKLLEREPALDPLRALEIASLAARGVGAAHAFSVFHGALAADSVLIDAGGVPRVSGFGLEATLERRNAPDPVAAVARAEDVKALGKLLELMIAKGKDLGPANAIVTRAAADPGYPDAVAFAVECERARASASTGLLGKVTKAFGKIRRRGTGK
jgi:serine/threonine-protein kinase